MAALSDDEFQQRIRSLVDKVGRQAVADRAGVSKRTVSRWANGDTVPPTGTKRRRKALAKWRENRDKPEPTPRRFQRRAYLLSAYWGRGKVAEQTGVTPGTVTSWRHGRSTPPPGSRRRKKLNQMWERDKDRLVDAHLEFRDTERGTIWDTRDEQSNTSPRTAFLKEPEQSWKKIFNTFLRDGTGSLPNAIMRDFFFVPKAGPRAGKRITIPIEILDQSFCSEVNIVDCVRFEDVGDGGGQEGSGEADPDDPVIPF